MRILLAARTFASLGGSETYLLTVSEQLQRLGHTVAVYCEAAGEMSAFARRRGIPILDRPDQLSDDWEAALVQEPTVSYAVAERCPKAPQAFVVHAANIEHTFPPQLGGLIAAIVVLSDRVARRVQGMGADHEVVRLRQPIDMLRFSPRLPVTDGRPNTVLALGNHLQGPPRELLRDACSRNGLALVQVGRHGRAELEPEHAIRAADIVVGYGRSLLEGMSCGRAAYVFDQCGGDGWVTPETYPRLEADGFAGGAFDEVIDGARLARDLAGWRAEMGVANRYLVRRNHNALMHAAELAQLLKRLAPRRAPTLGSLPELSRMTRTLGRAENVAAQMRLENESLRSTLRAERARHATELATAYAIRSTRRYRTAQLLAWPLDTARHGLHLGRAPAPAARTIAASGTAPAAADRVLIGDTIAVRAANESTPARARVSRQPVPGQSAAPLRDHASLG